MSAPTIEDNVYSFTVSSSCDEPLGHGCDQTLFKLELNSCEEACLSVVMRWLLASNICDK